MGKPPRYPNSAKTASERIPVRFCKQVRHFLETLDQLNANFEVRCTVYQAGALQPLQLIYTELEAATQFSAEVETPTEPVSQSGGLSAQAPASPAIAHLTPLQAGGLPDVPTLMPAFVSQNESGLETAFDTAPETEGQWETVPLSHDCTLNDVAQSGDAPEPQPTQATQSIGWEHSFTGDTTTTLTGRRPPTLTEILEGTYGGHAPAVQRTDVVAPDGLTLHPLEAETGPLPNSHTDPTPMPVIVEADLTEVAPKAEANGSHPEASTAVATPDLPLITSTQTPGATVFRERSAAKQGSDPTPPTVSQPTKKTWPTLDMNVMARFQAWQATTKAVPPVTLTVTHRQVEALPEPSTAALTARDYLAGDETTETATHWPLVESAVEPVEPAVDAALHGFTQVIEVDDLQAETEAPSRRAEEPPTTIPERPTPTERLTTDAPHTETGLISTTEATTTHPPIPAAGTALDAGERFTTLDEVPSATETQPEHPPAERDWHEVTTATGDNAPEPLASSLAGDRLAGVLPSPSAVSSVNAISGQSAADDLPSPPDEPLDASAIALAGEQNGDDLPSPSDDRAIALAEEVCGNGLPTESAGLLVTAEQPLPPLAGEALLSEVESEAASALPSATETHPETALQTEPVTTLDLTSEALPSRETVGLTGSEGLLETGVETEAPVGEGNEALAEALSPEGCSEGLETPAVPSQQAVCLSYTPPVEPPTPDTVFLPLESIVSPTTLGVDTPTETHSETVLQPQTVTDLDSERDALPSGVEAQVTGSEGLFETGVETALAVEESQATGSEEPPSGGLEGALSYSLQAVIGGTTSERGDQTLRQTEDEALLTLRPEVSDTETHLETVPPMETVSEADGEREPTTNALTSDSTPLPSLQTSALTSNSTPSPSALTPDSTPDSTPLDSAPMLIEAAMTEGGHPEALEAETDSAETPSLVTVKPPDQGFAEDLFIVWRRLALTQSSTVWGVVVSLEDIFMQGFSRWMAPHFMGSLAAAEGVEVTWGCAVQLVNEADTPYQERVRYRVGGKEVTGVTFQSPNARTSILETGGETRSLKPFAQSPALLTSLSATPLETERDRQTDNIITDPPQIVEADASQGTELSSVDSTQAVSQNVALADEEEEPAPTLPKPRKGWREGLRLLFGR